MHLSIFRSDDNGNSLSWHRNIVEISVLPRGNWVLAEVVGRTALVARSKVRQLASIKRGEAIGCYFGLETIKRGLADSDEWQSSLRNRNDCSTQLFGVAGLVG